MADSTLHIISGLVTDEMVLADGRRVAFRPISAGDRQGLATLFERLSPQSRYRRYLSPKRELTPRELTFLTDIDHDRHEAVAAVDQDDGSIVGVARYVVYRDRPKVADLAVEVIDALQHRGLGLALTRRMVTRACDNGVAVLTATMLWENQPARALLRRLGFKARGARGSEIELGLELSCPEALPLARELRC